MALDNEKLRLIDEHESKVCSDVCLTQLLFAVLNYCLLPSTTVCLTQLILTSSVMQILAAQQKMEKDFELALDQITMELGGSGASIFSMGDKMDGLEGKGKSPAQQRQEAGIRYVVLK